MPEWKDLQLRSHDIFLKVWSSSKHYEFHRLFMVISDFFTGLWLSGLTFGTRSFQRINCFQPCERHMSLPVRKRTFWHVRPTKTQISLRIRAVWSQSTLLAWRNFASLAIQNALSEDSDQTARMRRLIWIFAGHTCPKVRFLTLRLICTLSYNGQKIRRNKFRITGNFRMIVLV